MHIMIFVYNYNKINNYKLKTDNKRLKGLAWWSVSMCMLSVHVPAASHPFMWNGVSRQPLHGPLSVASNSKIAPLAVFARLVSVSGRAERGWVLYLTE